MSKLIKTAVGISLFALCLSAADSPFAGTWKQNAAKSKVGDSGLGTDATLRTELTGDQLKATVETTTPQGPLKFSYQAKLDGTPGTATGSPAFDTITIKRINDHTLTATGMKGGKVVFTDRRVVSSDGKTMTNTRHGTSPDGKQFTATLVFDKQ